MTTMDWSVAAAGLAAIAWVNWYFFIAGRRPVTAAGATTGSTTAEATITVEGGYSPSVVRVKAGRPVRLVFDRRETSSCSEEVVFPAFGVRKYLPAGQKTTVEITPSQPGRYEFTCGMSMLRGEIIAE